MGAGPSLHRRSGALQRHQSLVEAVPSEELLMRTTLNNAAVFNNEDAVRVPDRRHVDEMTRGSFFEALSLPLGLTTGRLMTAFIAKARSHWDRAASLV